MVNYSKVYQEEPYVSISATLNLMLVMKESINIPREVEKTSKARKEVVRIQDLSPTKSRAVNCGRGSRVDD